MLFPYLSLRTSGLRHLGRFRWRALDDDPQFLIGFRGYRPRFLLLLADGLDQEVEATLYVDRGRGFREADSVGFRGSGRLVCRVELHRMPEVRQIRFDPAEAPTTLRFVALGIGNGWVARQLAQRFSRARLPSGPTRLHTLRDSQVGELGPDGGFRQRRSREAVDLLANVARIRPAPDASARAPDDPLVSFLVPTYNTEVAFLQDLLGSFREQLPGVGELVLSDDGSTSRPTRDWLAEQAGTPGVKVVRSATNQGIAAATNRALAAAQAPWIGLIDHDDALAPGALERLARVVRARPDALLVYTDEIVADASLRPIDCFLKPAYDPVLLSGLNYINHLSVFRRTRVEEAGGLREGYEGSQDYELLLRYLRDAPADRILHLPYPAYLWRRHETSFSLKFENAAVATARRALAERFGHNGRPAPVEPALLPDLHRVRFNPGRTEWPSVSVVIPDQAAQGSLGRLLEGLARTDYPALEIIVVVGGAGQAALPSGLGERHAAGGRPVVIARADGHGLPDLLNSGIGRGSGDLVLLLSGAAEMIEPAWLKEMVECFDYEEVGIVGARLVDEHGAIWDAGMIVGHGKLAAHWFRGRAEATPGPMGRLGVRQSMSAVTSSAMLVSRRCLATVGLFAETGSSADIGVDYCRRAREAGFRVVWTPFATLLHHRPALSGTDRSADAPAPGWQREVPLGVQVFSDRALNPWYGLSGRVPSLRTLDELPEVR